VLESTVRRQKSIRKIRKKQIFRITYIELLKLIQSYPSGMTATELSKLTKWSRKRLDYHLRKLGKAGIITSEKVGLHRFYYVNSEITGGVWGGHTPMAKELHAYGLKYPILSGKPPESKHFRNLHGSKRDYFYFANCVAECYRNKPQIIIYTKATKPEGASIENLKKFARIYADAAIQHLIEKADGKLQIGAPKEIGTAHVVLSNNQLGVLVRKKFTIATEKGLMLGDSTPDKEGSVEITNLDAAKDFEWVFNHSQELKIAAGGYQTLLQAMTQQTNLVVQNTAIMQASYKILEAIYKKLTDL